MPIPLDSKQNIQFFCVSKKWTVYFPYIFSFTFLPKHPDFQPKFYFTQSHPLP
jgi:hypothetical protein